MNKEMDMDKCLAFAHGIARKYIKFAPPGMDENDLAQEGMLGLLEKIDTFDPNKCAFSTFAYNRMRWRIIKYLRESGFIRLADSNVKKKRKKGRYEVQIPILSLDSDARKFWDNINRQYMESDFLHAIDKANFLKDLSALEAKIDVGRILNLLSEEERKLIEIYYGLNGRPQMSMHKIAALKKRSSDTIYKRLNKISKKIKSLVR